MNAHRNTSSIVPIALGLAAGLVVGWLDAGATEVQGALLLLMLAAFVVALLSRAPAWAIALAVAAGLPIAHLAASAAGSPNGARWGMLIAAVPALLAAYGGRGVAMFVRSASASLAPPGQPTAAADRDAPWHARAASASALLGVALLGCAVAGVVPVYATAIARGQPFAWWVTTIWQIISFIAWVVATPAVLRFWNRTHSGDAHGITPASIAMHAAVATGIAAAHAVVLPVVTRALFIPLGPEGIAGATAWSFAAYLPLDALTYCLIVGLGHASDVRRQARAAEVRESAVRGELSSARLASLRAQLRPHFLFNALNAAIVLTRQGDRAGAERVLSGLADLLRYVLRGVEDDAAATADLPDSDFVHLGDEVAFAESYLDIERERFPDRLRTEVDVSAEARDAVVPHLVLQPLVENAIHHGIGARLGLGTICIRAWRGAETLHVTVEDDGPGLTVADEATRPNGIGLANTRARLATLYGGGAQLLLVSRPEGGASAHLTIPFRT